MSSPPIEGGDDAKGTLFDLHPMAWILVPMCFFVASMIALVYLRYRRKQRRARRAQWGTNSPLPTTNLVNNLPRGTTHAQPVMQQSTWTTRAWNITRFKRRDDGLNEYGEAPPTYEQSAASKETRSSMSTSTSSVPQVRSSPATSIGIQPPLGNVCIPMPGGPATYHPMMGDYLRSSPHSPRPESSLSQPKPAALR